MSPEATDPEPAALLSQVLASWPANHTSRTYSGHPAAQALQDLASSLMVRKPGFHWFGVTAGVKPPGSFSPSPWMTIIPPAYERREGYFVALLFRRGELGLDGVYVAVGYGEPKWTGDRRTEAETQRKAAQGRLDARKPSVEWHTDASEIELNAATPTVQNQFRRVVFGFSYVSADDHARSRDSFLEKVDFALSLVEDLVEDPEGAEDQDLESAEDEVKPLPRGVQIFDSELGWTDPDPNDASHERDGISIYALDLAALRIIRPAGKDLNQTPSASGLLASSDEADELFGQLPAYNRRIQNFFAGKIELDSEELLEFPLFNRFGPEHEPESFVANAFLTARVGRAENVVFIGYFAAPPPDFAVKDFLTLIGDELNDDEEGPPDVATKIALWSAASVEREIDEIKRTLEGYEDRAGTEDSGDDHKNGGPASGKPQQNSEAVEKGGRKALEGEIEALKGIRHRLRRLRDGLSISQRYIRAASTSSSEKRATQPEDRGDLVAARLEGPADDIGWGVAVQQLEGRVGARLTAVSIDAKAMMEDVRAMLNDRMQLRDQRLAEEQTRVTREAERLITLGGGLLLIPGLLLSAYSLVFSSPKESPSGWAVGLALGVALLAIGVGIWAFLRLRDRAGD